MRNNIFDPEQYLPGNELRLVASGEPYFTSLLQLIEGAQKQIRFLVYIFDEDETGKEIAEALKRAKQRGVDVQMTVDSYGSKDLSKAFMDDLLQSGIQFRVFSPLPERFYITRIGRRLHCKVVVADRIQALVGGINISTKYRGDVQEAPWLDFAIEAKGAVCTDLSRICERIYLGKFQKFKNEVEQTPLGNSRSKIALNDWFRRKNQIRRGYRTAFRQAQSTIYIVASYFMPGRSLRRALKNAVKRGVQVKILLPGRSDIEMAKRANTFLYRWLLRNKIEIFEWDKSILHGKIAVVDKKWTTIGSYNLNHLSAFSSIEINVETLDEPFATEVQNRLNDLLQQSIPVSADVFGHRYKRVNQFLDWLSYVTARWMMRLLFLLIKREYRHRVDEG